MSRGRHSGRPARNLLPGLLARVVDARDAESRELRVSGSRPEAVRAARLDTLLALRDYADALEDLSWPVPRSILMDIRMHQALTGPLSTR